MSRIKTPPVISSVSATRLFGGERVRVNGRTDKTTDRRICRGGARAVGFNQPTMCSRISRGLGTSNTLTVTISTATSEHFSWLPRTGRAQLSCIVEAGPF